MSRVVHSLNPTFNLDYLSQCPACKDIYDIVELGSHYETCVREKIKLIRCGKPRQCPDCGKVLSNNQGTILGCHFDSICYMYRSICGST